MSDMDRKNTSALKKPNSKPGSIAGDSSNKSRPNSRTNSRANTNSKTEKRAQSKSPSKSPAKSRSPSKRAESRSDSKTETKSNKSGTPTNKNATNNSLARAIANRRKSTKSAKTVQSWRTDFSVSSNTELDDFTAQGLTNLSLKIFQKTTLRKLILSTNNLRTIPPEISDLHNLEYLDISKNPLRAKDAEDVTSLPIELRLLTNLKFLSLSECNLRHIPLSVWLCVSLESLDISRNKLSLLVPDVGNLNELESINLSQCNLTSLPSEIGFCVNLRDIILMANPIESLPDTLKECKRLTSLRVSYRNFSHLLDSYMEGLIQKGQIKSEHVPQVAFELQRLASMDLQHTKINTLPDNNLRNIESLYLDHNYISTFPERVFNPMVYSLKTLTLSHNLLTEIPGELNCLVNLKVLDLAFNAITTISNASKMLALRELYLNNNKLQILNSEVKHFKNLRRLVLSNNELTELSDSLFLLNYLKYLDLSDNQLEKLSPLICNLRALKSAHSYNKSDRIGLWLLNNPLRVPSKQIWQTTSIAKIYEDLSTYEQRNKKCTFYAKLVFLGESGVGKTRLIDKFFNIMDFNETKDNKTEFARKLYKRTSNKVEWFIIDLGGEETYTKLHSTVVSSIDPGNEPTLFVLLYNHRDYTSEMHYHYLGSWIMSIMQHSRVCADQPLQIKLIGVVDDDSIETEAETEAKINMVLNDCGQTIISHREKLLAERERLGKCLERTPTETGLRRTLYMIENLLDQKVFLNGDIILVESSFKKYKVDQILTELEGITFNFNKTVPLDLNLTIKKHLVKLMKTHNKSMNYDQFIESIKENPEFSALMKKGDIDVHTIVHYAKTVGEIIWMKYDKFLGDQIFLQSDYVFNTIKMLINHELVTKFRYDENSMFKSLGLFESKEHFDSAVRKASQIGYFENQLIYGLCFIANQPSNDIIKESLMLMKKLSLFYISEPEEKYEKVSYFNLVIPDMCARNFEKEALESDRSDRDLFTANYENYFISLDKFERYCHLLKTQNILKKREKNFINELEEELKQEDGNFEASCKLSQIKIENIKLLNNADFLKNFLKNKQHLCEKIEDECNRTYHHVLVIECRSVFEFKGHVFARLSALVQAILSERYDWSNAIIGRDMDLNCFKIKFCQEPTQSAIRFELKSCEQNKLIKAKENIFNVIEELFSYYPGLYYSINYVS